MNRLREFYNDKQMKREVYDFIVEQAKNVLVERASKQLPTDFFRPLLEVLEDTDRELSNLYEVKVDKPKINKAR